MPDIPKFMNVLNLEARNAMDTRRMEHANAYMARANGLIKSASTSTCCANENAIFKKPHRKYLIREQNADFDETEVDTGHDDLNVSLVSSLALSVLARNATFYGFAMDENAAKNTLNFKFRLNHLKHLSDCNLSSVGLPSQQQQHRKLSEFNTHRALDNVLMGWTGRDGCGSIINFTTVNDANKDSSGMSGTSSIEKVDEERESSENAENTVEQTNAESADHKGEIQLLDDESEKAMVSEDETMTEQKSEFSNVTNEGETRTNVERVRKSSVFEAHPLLDCNGNETAITPPDDVDHHQEDEDTQPVTPTPVIEEKRFRRSSSLKMPKENDANPVQKKIVRFADALGLDLADVRTFLDELPSVPKSAYSDLKNEEPFAAAIVDNHLFSPSTPTTEKTLVPMFKQPHTSLSFLDRVRDHNISLEYAKVCPTPVCSINGIVRVRNLDFFKSVYVRYTVDGWQTYNELQAVYVPDSCDGFSDKFAFAIYVYDVKVNQRVELAFRFHCSGSQFWDNNNGSNYVFQCLPSAPIVPSYFRCYNSTNDSCNSFY